MVEHAYNHSTWEVEEGGSGVQGHPGLLNKTESIGLTMYLNDRACT
jgi:hypothetical protein